MCIGEAVDKALPDKIAQPYAPKQLRDWVPSLGESLDPHYMRTSGKDGKAERRHQAIGTHQEPPPPPPGLPARPQGARTPDTTPLRRRNNGGTALPSGSTMLTGPSGVATAQLNLGASSLLGGP